MTNEIEFNLWAFLEAIEWKDPLLIGIIFFHVAVTFTALTTRNHGNFQLILFITLLLLVYFSENINEVASHHWRSISRQKYFDSNGMFISLIFSVPILLNCMVMMASWLWQSSELMVQLKSAQLKQRRKQIQETNGKGDAIKEKSS
ncbi:Transmembrane protein 18 [Nesidiocoris tenuis]|uniref:Transmembrane protein 18 n=1 Tax=Nesidiocoris tenuis TaxID=355587 RepID=A0ABN7A8C2_9HEMI|nr:Transmembrane protein 18 [Nesidiocoris tenuis]